MREASGGRAQRELSCGGYALNTADTVGGGIGDVVGLRDGLAGGVHDPDVGPGQIVHEGVGACEHPSEHGDEERGEKSSDGDTKEDSGVLGSIAGEHAERDADHVRPWVGGASLGGPC